MANAESDFYRRPGSAPKESATTEELAHSLELTTAIAANLKAIAADATDMEMLEHRLEGIVAAMKLVREQAAEMNLPQLELRLASISTALRIIESDSIVQELKAER